MTASTASIADNLKRVRASISKHALDAQRDPNNIHLLAVSKTKPVSDILLAYESGQRHFGENYVQEGVDKIQQLKQYSDILWHFIGPLQSNKSKFIAEHFDWMHSLDRLKIARRLNEQRTVHQQPLNVLIQVNIDDEQSKAGVEPDAVLSLLDSVKELKRLHCRGLMCIPKAGKEPDEQAKSFAQMLSLFSKCQNIYPQFDTLSMGMSADLGLAIEYGSTMVRVGTDIFGARS